MIEINIKVHLIRFRINKYQIERKKAKLNIFRLFD